MGILWNRRTFLGSVAAVAGSAWSGVKVFASTGPQESKLTGLGSTGNVYDELGVTTLINGQGTMTELGGSLIRPEVDAVMAQATQHFVRIPDLEVAAGKRIAQLLKLPDGYTAIVTSGAAAAIQSGLAGVLTGDDEALIRQLPDVTGMKSEVIIQKSHRNAFDHQLRGTGIKLIAVETLDEFKAAAGPRTAMTYFLNLADPMGQIKREDWLKLCQERNIPAMIDAAADTPPVSHLWDYANMGFDMITFSGGKAMRGPQCAGLLIGREKMVHCALLNNSPYEDTIGRGMKVGKEEIVGMVKALELYLNEDHDAITAEWWKRLNLISGEITKVAGVSTADFVPEIANHVPHMRINWDPQKIKLTPEEAFQALRSGKPSIMLADSPGGLAMNSFMLQPGEDKIIAGRLVELFRAHAA
ncbi:MAG: aminotransferase class V-fold PLP-dependent enzyme [Candidatus Acidiferrales bacterium]